MSDGESGDGMTMIEIELDAETESRLREMAAERGVELEELIREAVREGLAADEAAQAEGIARMFHTVYEHLAPAYGYRTREESAVAWERVPERNRALMKATVRRLLDDGVIAVGAVYAPGFQLGHLPPRDGELCERPWLNPYLDAEGRQFCGHCGADWIGAVSPAGQPEPERASDEGEERDAGDAH